jgi:hypothetical protein
MPLWVKLFGGVVVLLLLVVAALHLTGRAGHGLH